MATTLDPPVTDLGFPVDPLPRVIAAAEWDALAAGLCQRTRALDAFVAETQAAVTGEVRLELSPGRCQPTGRRAERALYRPDLATYEAGDAFDHDAGRGFVSLWGLPARTWARVHGDG